MIAWMLYVIAASGAFAITALLAERSLRLIGMPSRWAWCACTVTILGAAVFSWRSQEARSTYLTLPTQKVSPSAAKSVPRAAPLNLEARAETPGVDAGRTVLVLWMLSSSAGALALVLGFLSLKRRTATWRDEQIDGVAVKVSDGLGPAVVGVFAPVIALPAWVLDEPAERRRLIVAHEQEHVRARDQWLLALLLFVAVAMPWNIALWWVLLRIKAAIEIDCDARVTQRHPGVATYAHLLIDVGGRALPSFVLPALAESPTTLEKRIMALTTTRPRHASSRAIVLGTVATLIAGWACELPRPSGPGAVRPTASTGGAAQQFTEVPAPLPPGAADVIDAELDRAFPQVRSAGLSTGQAVWVVADQNGRVVKSWVGPGYSEAVVQKVVRSDEFDAFRLVTWVATRPARNGTSVPVVWAADQVPWIGSLWVNDRMKNMIRDSLHGRDATLLQSVAPTEALYYEQDTQSRKVNKIWTGPLLSDAKVRWEYVRSQYGERVALYVTPVTVASMNGNQVPVIHVIATAWARRYGE